DLILNFGGPGGSGVGTLLNIAPLLTDVFGSGVNLISFDPRGVNNTGPALDRFPNYSATKAIFESQNYRIIADTPDNIATQFYLAESFGRWCDSVIGGPNGRQTTEAFSVQPLEPLFPDRIGRFIPDGVADGKGYYGGSWSKSLIDTDKVVEGLISSCLDAGKEACTLYEDSFEAIEYRLSNILTRLKQHSIPVWDPAVVDVPALATFADWSQLPPSANKTSAPILFIGNKADPVTPLVEARRASTFFPDSGLVEINGIGHTSLGAPSQCAFKEMRKYLSGASPLPFVSCKPDEVPFQNKLEGLALLTEIWRLKTLRGLVF
ncbi:unnamed protein product, partial [Clonostachys rhizophaga]